MRDEIVITNIDKGGAAVIMDVKDYVEECERQLNNTGNYNRLKKGPTATNKGNKKIRNHKIIPQKYHRRTQNKLSAKPPILYSTNC